MKITSILAIIFLFNSCTSSADSATIFNETTDKKNRTFSERIPIGSVSDNEYAMDTITSYSSSTKTYESNKIPDSVFQMTNLKYLSIWGMDCDYRETDENGNDITRCWMIHEIPVAIKNLIYLEELYLNVNAISSIPIEMSGLKNLRIIDLTDNSGLRDLDNLGEITSLEEAYFNGCNLTKMPENIGNLQNLKILGLSGNYIDPKEQERIKMALPNCKVIFE